MKRFKRTYDSISGNYYEKARLFKWWHIKRYSLALKLAKTEYDNLNILDVGCDGGNLTASLLRLGNVVGLDISNSFIDNAHKTYRGPSFLIGDGQRLPLKRESFDIVTCLEVLEHVPNPSDLVIEINRILKSKGRLIIIVPNEGNILWRFIWYFWQRIGRGRAWRDLHISFFDRDMLLQLLSPYFGHFLVKWVNFFMLLLVRCEKKNPVGKQ